MLCHVQGGNGWKGDLDPDRGKVERLCETIGVQLFKGHAEERGMVDWRDN